MQPFAVESRGFHQNAQKLTGNANNWQILNIMFKYSLLDSWKGNHLKSINTGDILKAVMTEEKFAKSERYKINGKHFHPKN